MGRHYLSFSEVAQLLGVPSGSLSGYKLPEPDVWIGRTRGWSQSTIEQWNASRPGHGGRPRKK